ncbi:MAG: lantibiotic dehydratase [Candidatus Sulfotelmatobacter sp.]
MQTTVTQEAPVAIANHLIRPAGSEWAFWRCVCLRSAGFPFDGIFKLAARPELIFAADEVGDAMQSIETARSKARQDIDAALDELRATGRWHDKRIRKALLNAKSDLNAQKVPLRLAEVVPLNSIEELVAAVGRLDVVRSRFSEQFERSAEQTSAAIREIAQIPEFREAITWQNRRLVRQVLDSLLHKSGNGAVRNSRQRQSEETAAMYWQRYCAKNDTIGFFGPLAWADILDQEPALVSNPGDQLIASSGVYFEEWGIAELADTLNRNVELKRYFVPRRLPYLYVMEDQIRTPDGFALPVPKKLNHILLRIDGERTAEEIWKLNRQELGVTEEEQFYACLQVLENEGLIAWKIETPLQLHPDRCLKEAVLKIGNEVEREKAVHVVQSLDQLRIRAGKCSSPEQLLETLETLDAAFETATGKHSSRLDGKQYAARTLVYQECRRDVRVSLSTKLVAELMQPLSLILCGARWFTHQLGVTYRRTLQDVYEKLVATKGSSIIDMVSYWQAAETFLHQEDWKLTTQPLRELQQHWLRILGLQEKQSQATYSSALLQPEIKAAFSVPDSGWRLANYHSPDIMLIASSAEEVCRGEYQAVLGEVHIANNTLRSNVFAGNHPAPRELFEAISADMPGLHAIPIPPKGWGTSTVRTTTGLFPECYWIESDRDTVSPYRSRAIGIGELAVEDDGNGLSVRTRDGRLRFDILEFFSEILTSVASGFKMLPLMAHQPRITFDRLTVARETWNLPISDLPSCHEMETSESFLSVRRWGRNLDLPRFGFIRVPTEDKPVFVDFDSIVSVEIFARLVRKVRQQMPSDGWVSYSEMLPAPHQLWLADHEGNRYTSEFRFVVVDQNRLSPPSMS